MHFHSRIGLILLLTALAVTLVPAPTWGGGFGDTPELTLTYNRDNTVTARFEVPVLSKDEEGGCSVALLYARRGQTVIGTSGIGQAVGQGGADACVATATMPAAHFYGLLHHHPMKIFGHYVGDRQNSDIVNLSMTRYLDPKHPQFNNPTNCCA